MEEIGLGTVQIKQNLGERLKPSFILEWQLDNYVRSYTL